MGDAGAGRGPGGPGPAGPPPGGAAPAGPGPIGPAPGGPPPGGAGPPPLEGDGLLLLGPLDKLGQSPFLPDYLLDPEVRREVRRRSDLGGPPLLPAPPSGLAVRKADYAFDLEAPGFRELIEKIFAAYDRNHDGVITSDEYHDPLD